MQKHRHTGSGTRSASGKKPKGLIRQFSPLRNTENQHVIWLSGVAKKNGKRNKTSNATESGNIWLFTRVESDQHAAKDINQNYYQQCINLEKNVVAADSMKYDNATL